MRESVRRFVEVCADTLPAIEPIFEFGSLQVPGQEGFSNLRPFFPGKVYVGTDRREGLGVDVVMDLFQIPLPRESVGTVVVVETLEHAEFPRKALEEIYRILKPNGIVIQSSVMNFPIHNYPHDYWRFTPEAFKSLLREFSWAYVESAGRGDFPHTVVAVGCKGSLPQEDVRKFERRLGEWKSSWSNPLNLSGSNWKGFVQLLTPPLFLDIYKKLRGV